MDHPLALPIWDEIGTGLIFFLGRALHDGRYGRLLLTRACHHPVLSGYQRPAARVRSLAPSVLRFRNRCAPARVISPTTRPGKPSRYTWTTIRVSGFS